MVETDTLDKIVDALANGEFCANLGKLLKKDSAGENLNLKLKILSKYNHYTVKLLHKLTGDERCPAVVNAVIRQGLPLLTGKYGIDVALGYQKPAHEQLLEEAVQKGPKNSQ